MWWNETFWVIFQHVDILPRSWIHSNWQEILLGHNWSNGGQADSVRPEEVLKRDWQATQGVALRARFSAVELPGIYSWSEELSVWHQSGTLWILLPRASISYTAFMQRQIRLENKPQRKYRCKALNRMKQSNERSKCNARWNHHKSFELKIAAPLPFWVLDIFQAWNQNLIDHFWLITSLKYIRNPKS